MKRIDTLIIGGGQAGLAVSRHLSERGQDHVVLERGRIGERWRSERWDSLRLLTPNWLNRLPGGALPAADPDGFMARGDVVDFLDAYAASFAAPVEQETTVRSVTRRDGRWVVRTNRGSWIARNVVIATGACDRPYVPAISQGLADDVLQLATTTYRNPAGLPAGGVLVVGASASGVQLADELRRSGRDVMLAVGRHTRLPRRYRGRDIMRWLDLVGVLDRSIEQVSDPEAARREPSLQLVGRDSHESLDLAVLRSRGVTLTGRMIGADEHRVRFADDLVANAAEADAKLQRVLRRIDRYVDEHELAAEVGPAEIIPPVATGASPAEIDLRQAGIRTVLWATGYRRVYPWLHAPVLDRRGEIIQERGRTPAPGLYVLGLPFMTHRKSPFIGGVGQDAREIASRIAGPVRRNREIAA